MHQHRVIQGREYRIVTLQAADTREASQHISAEPPTPCWERKLIREEVAAER